MGLAVKKPWVFPKIGVSQNGWFIMIIMENPIEMDDLGGKPTIFGNTHMIPHGIMECLKGGRGVPI